MTTMLKAKPTLEKIVAEQVRRAPADQQPLLAWSVVCGKTVADKTRATALSDGQLTVVVPDRGWKNELASFAGQYVAGINRIVGEEVVQQITFVAAEPKKPSTEKLGTGY